MTINWFWSLLLVIKILTGTLHDLIASRIFDLDAFDLGFGDGNTGDGSGASAVAEYDVNGLTIEERL